MATTITELNTVAGAHEDDWILNVYTTDASDGIVLRAAATDYRHGIESIILTASEDEWIQILDGEDVLIGNLNLEKGIPWSYRFENNDIYCTRGNALGLKSESGFNIHLIIEGDTGQPVSSLSASVSTSPSASPSEGP